MTIIRVIPCLDVNAGRVVKGVNFLNLRDAGDPVELGSAYEKQGADELTLLDISASAQGRATTLEVVKATAAAISIPFIVGGGIRNVADVEVLLEAGANMVGVNTAAIGDPGLIDEIVAKFGSQVLVLGVDARRESGLVSGFGVTTHGGSHSAGLDAIDWVCQAADRGVGQIMLNSMDADGTTVGFDLEMLQAVKAAVDVPLIASGGAGRIEDFVAAAQAGADAVLAASVFHFATLTVADVKSALVSAGFEVHSS